MLFVIVVPTLNKVLSYLILRQRHHGKVTQEFISTPCDSQYFSLVYNVKWQRSHSLSHDLEFYINSIGQH